MSYGVCPRNSEDSGGLQVLEYSRHPQTVLTCLKRVERLCEREVSDDIECREVEPAGNVNCPFLGTGGLFVESGYEEIAVVVHDVFLHGCVSFISVYR